MANAVGVAKRVRTIHVDDIEAIAIAGVKCKPVRATLGIEAFGVNAYVGEPGELVVLPHREARARQDEVYIVVNGRATFRVEDQTCDAPARTLVFVRAGEHREARAEQPATLVVAVGARAGEPHSISPWDYEFRAYGAYRTGRLDEARAVIDEGLARFPRSASLHFSLACVESLRGDGQAALDHLGRALELGESVREWIPDEPALQAIRDHLRLAEMRR